MCGIAGFVNFRGRSAHLVNKLNHRGPDDFGTESADHVEFIHTRLSVIGGSEYAQPIKRGNRMLTINGEIYNYRDFVSPHANDSYAFFDHIEERGIDKALSDANGMFAFAYYDGEKVTLAVDRLGQKPLYYYRDGKTLTFASTPNALLHLKSRWRINSDALNSYWLLGGIMGENSIFDGIKRLNAAEIATFDPETGEFEKKRYWDPKLQENTTGIEDLVLDAIRQVKVSDVPVQVFLSGGVDSTLVASQCEGMDAIHLDGPERQYAEQVSQRFGLELAVVSPTDTDPVKAMTDYITKSGEPAMAALIPWLVSREAARFGKVAITANGADELFFGYNRTNDHVCAEQVRHIFRDIAHAMRMDVPWIGDVSGRELELRDYVQFDLNQTLDRASMCHSLEVRSPFLDHRLVEMALSIPEHQHRNGYGNKSILKKMLKSMGFEESFFQRPKLGFSLFATPPKLPELQQQAFDWAVESGWLSVPDQLSARDSAYLKASAFSFKIWHQTYEQILQ